MFRVASAVPMMGLWLNGMAAILAGVGFLWGPGALTSCAVLSSLWELFLVRSGYAAQPLAGSWVAFGLLSILFWIRWNHTQKEHAGLEQRIHRLKESVVQLQGEWQQRKRMLQEQEEAIQKILGLYDLSKRFLATLDMEEGLRVLGEFLGTWIPQMNDPERAEYLERLRLQMGQREGVMHNLVEAPAAVEAHPNLRERWGIVRGQLTLGLQRISLYTQVQESALHDGLTGLLGRRHFRQRFEEEVERARRRGTQLAFLMVDIDDFKKVNDSYGHLVGDVVLRDISAIIQHSVREMDLVGRYGGEEFSVALPEATRELGVQIADRIRQAIERTVIQAYDERIQVTVSVGVAFLPEDAASADKLIERADQAMYEAKRAGRNRVISADQLKESSG